MTGLPTDKGSPTVIGLTLWPFILLLLGNGLLFTPDNSLPRLAGAMILLLLPGLLWASWLWPSLDRLTQLLIGLGLSYSFIIIAGMGLYYFFSPISWWSIVGLFNVASLLPLLLRLIVPTSGDKFVVPTLVGWGSLKRLLRTFQFAKPNFITSLLIIIFLLATFFRVSSLGYSEFLDDETEAMLPAARALEGYPNALFLFRRKGPSELLLPMMVWRLQGAINEATARLPFTIAGLGALLTLYVLGRRLLGDRPAVMAFGLLALNGFMVAFSRIVQYQMIVVWMSGLALLMAWEWYRQGEWRWPALAGGFLGIGFLAHYDAILVAPAVAYLLVRRPATGFWRPALISLGCFLLVTLPFYLPYLANPQLEYTQSHLSNRIGQSWWPKNNLDSFLQYTIFYCSFYYLLFSGLLALGWLSGQFATWPRLPHHPATRYGLPALIGFVLLGLFIWPTTLQGGDFDGAGLPFGLLFAGAFIANRSAIGRQTMVLWFAVPFLGYNFAVAQPWTHIYTVVPAWLLIAGLAGDEIWSAVESRWPAGASLAPITILMALGIAGLTVLFSGYLYLAYLRQDVEFAEDWPASRHAIYWTPYDDRPGVSLFGFPHRAGWKAIGGLYATNLIQGDYYSNKKEEVTGWYTRNAARISRYQLLACQQPPAYYFINHHGGGELGIDKGIIEATHEPVGWVSRPVARSLVIYEPRQTATSMGELPAELLGQRFDETATPAAFVADFYIQIVDVNFDNLIRLVDYTVNSERAHPGGEIEVALRWQPQTDLTADYHVFVHLERQPTDGPPTVVSQANGQPACEVYPTSQWQVADRVPDWHTLHLDPTLPPGEYVVVAGLYLPQTDSRLPILDEAGQPRGNFQELARLMIR